MIASHQRLFVQDAERLAYEEVVNGAYSDDEKVSFDYEERLLLAIDNITWIEGSLSLSF